MTLVAYTGLQFGLLILWAVDSSLQTRVSIAAAALSLISALVIFPLSYAEHTRSVRPSLLLSVYLLFSLLFDITQARTLFLVSKGSVIPKVFVSGSALKLTLLFLESQEKRSYLRAPYTSYPPEAIGGIFNITFFWWLNNLFRKGFRVVLDYEDLYSIDKSLQSETLRRQMQRAWDRRCILY